MWGFSSDTLNGLNSAQLASSGLPSSAGTLFSNRAPTFLLFQPSNYSTETTASVGFSRVDRVPISDYVNYLVPTNNSNKLYAVTKNTHSLYVVDPFTESVSFVTQLPLQNIQKLVFSSIDSKLFGYTSDSGKLLIYDIASDKIQIVTYASSSQGQGISLDPIGRRIYLCANQTLYILNEDTLQIISSASLGLSRGDIYFSRPELSVFFSTTGGIRKYSVASDIINDSGMSYSGADYFFYPGFSVNASGTKLVSATADEAFVRTIDTKTMLPINTWNLDIDPIRTIFSADDMYAFVSVNNGKIFRAAVNDFSQIETYSFSPDPLKYYVVNSDDTKLVGFSGDIDGRNFLYFLDVSSAQIDSTSTGGEFATNRALSRNMIKPLRDAFPRTYGWSTNRAGQIASVHR